jgi:hypothetical protein
MEPSMKPPRSARQWSLFAAGIGVLIVLATSLIGVYADVRDLGVPIVPGILFVGGWVVILGGLVGFFAAGE